MFGKGVSVCNDISVRCEKAHAEMEMRMGRLEEQEMEQIQKGLEDFLSQELGREPGQESGRNLGQELGREPEQEPEQNLGQEFEQDLSQEIEEMREEQREPQIYTLEDWDSPDPSRRRSRGEQSRSTRNSRSGRGEQSRSTRNTGTGRGEQSRTSRNYRNSERGEERTGSRRRRENDREHWEEKPQSRREAKKAAKQAQKRAKRQRRKRRGIKLLAILLFLILLLGAGLYSLAGVLYNKLNYEEIASVSDLPLTEDGVVNILLIGNDSRENGEDGRSDAMILLSISRKTKTIYMTSLLRDMYVKIPGHDDNRLNAAYSFGGAELLMQTVEENLGIPVNRYVQVNFEAFANLVDAVDGVELELTTEEIEYVNGYLVEYNMLLNRPQGTDNMDTSVSGLVHLNGAQALAYCRNRYLGTDFGRTERQRKVLEAVIKKLPQALLTNSTGLFDGLLPNLTTNLTKAECIRLGLMGAGALTYEITADSIPQPGTWQDATIRKMAVLQVDFEANQKYLKEKLYGE